MSTYPLHEHCQTCIKVPKCKVTACPPFSCDIISCDLECGWKFHQCKREEHAEICLKEKVPCINSGNGCPAVLQRQKLASHLSVCPASVIQCTMEWNRWPVYCKERQARVPFAVKQHYARYRQLDVALALRDQRMLNKSMKVPVRVRRVLRNGLTKRFPAVPIAHNQRSPEPDSSSQTCSNSTSCTVSDDDSDAPWQQWRNPPGLQSSVCNELFRATKRTTDSLTAALNLLTTSGSIQAAAEEKPAYMTQQADVPKDVLQSALSEDNKSSEKDAIKEEKPAYMTQQADVPKDVLQSALSEDNKSSEKDAIKGTDEVLEPEGVNNDRHGVTGMNCASSVKSIQSVLGNNGHLEMDDHGSNNTETGTYSEGNHLNTNKDNTIEYLENHAHVVNSTEMLADNSTSCLSPSTENQEDHVISQIPCTENPADIKVISQIPGTENPADIKVISQIPCTENPADIKEAVITKDKLTDSSHGDDDLMFDHTKIGIGSNICNPDRSIPVPPPQCSDSVRLLEVLGLDINVEWIAPYQHKPKSMYTFLCAQVFRRDEFPWHFKNMHGDIVSNLNGWLEQRCPLASQGCTFSMRRLEPSEKGAEIVYNTAVEAFGVKPIVPRNLLSHRESVEKDYIEYLWKTKGTKESTPEIFTSKDFNAFVKVHGNLNRRMDASVCSEAGVSSTRHDVLTSLPVEILQHIGRFLDGFSLNNLALTSKLLREVCSSLLEEKGLVTQEWQKVLVDGKPSWVIAFQRWMFSTSFHPIKSWTFIDNPHMSEHLKQCPFYVKAEAREEPVRQVYSEPLKDIDRLNQTMQKMYPKFNINN